MGVTVMRIYEYLRISSPCMFPSVSALRCACLALIPAPDARWISHPRSAAFVLVDILLWGVLNWENGRALLKINCLLFFSMLALTRKTRFAIWAGCYVCYGFSRLSDTSYELYHYYWLNRLLSSSRSLSIQCSKGAAT